MKRISIAFLFTLFLTYPAAAQKAVKLHVSPDPIIVEVGKTTRLEVKGVDAEGKVLKDMPIYYFPVELKGVAQNMIFTGGIRVDTIGVIQGIRPGVYDLFVNRVPDEGEMFANEMLKVTVVNQPVAKIKIDAANKVYEGAIFGLNIVVTDRGDFEVHPSEVEVISSNTEILKVDKLQKAYALKKGTATVTARIGEVSAEIDIEVQPNPVARLELESSKELARTGDVIYFKAKAYDKSSKALTDFPLTYSVSGHPLEPGSGSAAQINNEGNFVAEKPGIYTITASSGNNIHTISVEIVERNITRPVILKGHGRVNTKHTSDLWVWEGVDGKDYAVTGTWGADGKAYFWDVTDPSGITLVDSIQVDARTVNDVKVSEDGKICVISREGASSRKNGIVILDVSNPRDVKELSTYTENLTGGVHNVFISKGYVYALSNGQWYEIIDIRDPKNPKGVSKFELSNSTRFIHDVWVENGIAYSSNWSDGIVMVDVGNGVAGGSPENPVEIARARVQGDANHAAFPYKSKDTGKFYVIAGDEIFPLAAMSSDNLSEIFIPDGYLHFMDMSDPKNPKEVARYEVPEAGSHNFWVEDDKLYIGYYNGGLRVVDISGDLMGDLYKQGREIAHFLPFDANGFIPNSPFVWGAQPHKGHIFFSDFNSGLWAAQVAPEVPEKTSVQTK